MDNIAAALQRAQDEAQDNKYLLEAAVSAGLAMAHRAAQAEAAERAMRVALGKIDESDKPIEVLLGKPTADQLIARAALQSQSMCPKCDYSLNSNECKASHE